ncbi:hypothetical protein SESBI_40090 [Sesbania bispinosa]|nr:hypothetical protein SESBI_40090 [Sesbania bispinosa]
MHVFSYWLPYVSLHRLTPFSLSHGSFSHFSLGDSSSSTDADTEDSSSELIPKAISFTAWTHLAPARENPVDASGEDFFRDSLVTPVIHQQDVILFHDVPNIPTHFVAPSLLRSHLKSREFSWSTIHFMTRATSTGCWSKWIDYVFSNDAPFVEILTKVGVAYAIRMSPKLGTIRQVEYLDALVQRWSHTTHIFYASWGEFTPTLEDVHVLMKLPLLEDSDISCSPACSHLIDMAKYLKNATIESAKYSQEFLAKCRNDPVSFDPASKTPHRKVKGTRNILPPEKRTRIPLAPLFLGGFYGCLDQIQDQMLSSFGRFPINSFVDLVFLQYFLFERFPEYAPIRAVLSLPLREKIVLLILGHGAGLWVARVIRFLTLLTKKIISSVGGAFWPYAYRPDRVCCQFGLDQLPCSIDIAFNDVGEAMKAILLKTNEALSAFDPSKFIPSTRVGRVLDVWVAYYAKFRTSIKLYEREASQWAFPNVPIISKKHKSSSIQESKTKDSNQVVPASKKKKNVPASKFVFMDSVPGIPVRKQGATRSPKSKKEPARPTRASERLKVKPVPKDLPPTSPSNSLVIPDVASAPGGSLGERCFFSPGDLSKAMVLAPSFPTATFAQDLSIEVVPILGSLLSDEDAKVIRAWFDELSRCLDHHIPSAALEDLVKIREDSMSQDKRNANLKAQIERLRLKQSQGELELECLSAKRHEIEDAHVGLDVLLNV